MTKNELTKIDKYSKKLRAINLLGGKCKCGENRFFRLTFHHLDPNVKEKDISQLFSFKWSIIEKELKSCILICGNCHHELHFSNQVNKRKKENKKILLDIVSVYGCEDCGYNKNVVSLTFHHKYNKIFRLSGITKIKSILEIEKEILDELEKCKVLCTNCHLELHGDLKFFNENYDLILEKSKNIKEYKKHNHDEIIKLYKNGMKQSEISKKIGCSKSTVSETLKSCGMQMV